MKPLPPFDWRADALASWTLAIRMMALAVGSVSFQTVTEMYFVESRGGIP